MEREGHKRSNRDLDLLLTMVTDYGHLTAMEELTISKFKATCLAVLEHVRTTGESVLITKRGEPVAEVVPVSRPRDGKRRLGSLADRGRVVGDIVSPVVEPQEWESISR